MLLADDYGDAAEMWALFLRGHGFDVVTARDGLRALQLAIAGALDAVILDLDLPALSGWDVAASLRARRDTAHLPLIAATGWSDPAGEAPRLAPFDGRLTKPVDPDALLAELERVLHVERHP